jgi:hypothetical protein
VHTKRYFVTERKCNEGSVESKLDSTVYATCCVIDVLPVVLLSKCEYMMADGLELVFYTLLSHTLTDHHAAQESMHLTCVSSSAAA